MAKTNDAESREESAAEGREFDLQPHPRILMMLGEINLAEWQCIAELVDNAIDGFLRAERAGHRIDQPEIHIHLPSKAGPNARITVRDNGPGMDPDTLENAVKAGWTSNDPMGSLGLFGMGFNIATARLGQATQVWSSLAGEDSRHGVEINFEELTEQRHFRTPMLTGSKPDPESGGTEVVIERLKPDQMEWFTRAANQSKLRRDLAQIYSAILRDGGRPLGLNIYVNGTALRGRRHCVWGGAESLDRTVHHRRLGEINAFLEINQALPKRRFCFRCWYWLPSHGDSCPACCRADEIVERDRRIYGWLGIQRHVDETEFGIDFLRHGRKIERFNKDLFDWDGGESTEREYPIDDPRHRGRIVGEIHLDHCRVTYTKDRFERNDPAWADMVRVLRGEGPLRPEKAAQAGYGPNGSALFLLFQGFRRHNPKTKVAGGYRDLLAVPDNDRAKEMAARFHQGDPEYQSDEKWYDLIEEAETALLVDDGGVGGDEGKDDFWDEDESSGDEGADDQEADEAPQRTAIPSLSREYVEHQTHQHFPVEGLGVQPSDPDLGDEEVPWRLIRDTSGEYRFLVNASHRVFRSVTLTPLDALLAEMAWSATDFVRGQPNPPSFGVVLAGLRLQYAGATELDPVNLNSDASAALRSIATSLSGHLDEDDAKALFDDLHPHERRHVLEKLVAIGGGDATQIVEGGRFLDYAPRASVLKFFEQHPGLFFDGRYWEIPYDGIDLGDTEANEQARARMVRRHAALIGDAIWLAEQDPSDLDEAGRSRLMRAALALELLAEDVAEDDG